MKLPTYTPQVDVPGSFPEPTVPTGSPIGAALQQAGTEVEDLGVKAVHLLSLAEAQKARYQQALDASKAETDVLDRLDTADQTLRLGTRDPTTGEMVDAPATSQDYVPRYVQAMQQARQDVLSQIQDPTTRVAADKLLETTLRERLHQARVHSNQLFMDSYDAGLEEQLRGLATLTVNAPDDVTRAQYEARASGLLTSATGALKPERIQNLAQGFEEQVDTATALQRADTNPEQEQQRLESGFYRLKPQVATRLSEQIGAREERRQRQAEADERRAQADADKRQKQAYQTDISDANVDATLGTLTLKGVNDLQAKWRGLMTREDYDALVAKVQSPPLERKSDPHTLQTVIADVHSATPQMTERQLMQLNLTGQLNNEDYKASLDTLRTTTQHRENQQKTQVMQRQSQAEQDLRATLGIPTLFDKLDPAKEKAWALALQELTARSAAFDGKEDPLAVAREIGPRYQAMLGDDAQASIEQIDQALRWKTPQELDLHRREISLPEYQVQRQLFDRKALLQKRLPPAKKPGQAGKLGRP